MTAFAQAEVFGEQVTTNSLAQNIVYVSGTMGALVILAGLLMVDMGGVRRRNVFDSVIQKLIGFFIGRQRRARRARSGGTSEGDSCPEGPSLHSQD